MAEPIAERLTALVERKTEEPDVEYKSWMDLSDAENRAKIAKHICGLANFGGGYIIFGVNDDGSFAEPHATDLTAYRQDVINSIAAKYLTPGLHCNVHFVRASNERDYPVVIVPSHGAQPVCAKSDGPLVNGKRVGLQKGVHYIRLPGPRTEAIDSPDLWQQVLHRCVLKERDRLLSAISGLIEKPQPTQKDFEIDIVLDALASRWAALQLSEPWIVDLLSNRAIYAFQLLNEHRAPVQAIDLNDLREAARRASFEAEQYKGIEISAFEAMSERDYCSIFVSGDVEGYEIQHVHKNGKYLVPLVLARISSDGGGGEVRGFWEDTEWVKKAVEEKSSRKWNPGTRLSPRFQAGRALNFIAFVKNLANSFPDARYAAWAVDYTGLDGRIIGEPRSGAYFSLDYTSRMPSRRVKAVSQLDILTETKIAELAAELIRPIFRLFDGWKVSAEFVSKSRTD
jgi:hypothetical protein